MTAMRQKREEEKLKKLYDEEVSFINCKQFNLIQVERRRIDAIEDELNAEKRRQAIE